MGKPGLVRALTLAVALIASGCETLDKLGDSDTTELEGRRIAVLPTPEAPKADVRISDVAVLLPRPAVNIDWPQHGGYPNHAMHHPALGDDPRQAWSAPAGSGSQQAGLLSLSRSRLLLSHPVIGGDRVFSMDSRGEIRAFDLQTGRQLWSRGVLPQDEQDGDVGGGIAYHEDRVFAASGAAEAIAIDAATGAILWRVGTGAPVRSPPTVSEGRLFVVTAENSVVAFDTRDGRKLWTHEGVAALTGVLGSGAVAVDEGIVVAPRSSGQVTALRADTGRLIWTETLGTALGSNPVSGLGAVIASPVIDRGVAFALSNAGRLAAIELGSGRRLWDMEISGRHTPWVAGNYVFVLTSRAALVALRRSDGLVRWAIGLDRFTDDDVLADGQPFWTGPVLAGDRLLVAGSHGEALAVSPYTGEVIGWIPLDEGLYIPPVIAQRTILFLDDGGRLTALR